MLVRHFILATAGHVDHGKSALVRALTGTDPDRLPEEKARGITIDLGFAHLDLPAPPGPGGEPARFSIGVVDVPGHEDFVKNMVAGVGSIDLALLVVAADDGWMPQTEEHLQILEYLGVRLSVVAVTKIDLAAGREAGVIAAARARLEGTPFAGAPLVPTSVVDGRGLDELKAALARALATAPAPPDLGKPRLSVDRAFTLKGVGTVVTGTLTGGTLRRGQPVVVQPGGQTARIRSLQSHNTELELALPGQRVALNLPDLAPRVEAGPAGVGRGDTITIASTGAASDTVDVLLTKSARLSGQKIPAARPLKDRSRVRVHFGSANAAVTVFLHGGGELAPGGRALAQLRFESPAYLFGGDRFIIRDWSEQATLAGGVVLDPDGNRKHWQHRTHVPLLAARAAAPQDVSVWVTSLLQRDGVVARAGLLARSRFSAAEIAAALDALAREGRIVLTGELAADAARWQAWLKRAAEAIDQAHRAHPEWPGLPLAELHGHLAAELALPGAFEALARALCQSGFVQTGTAIRRSLHRPVLPPRLQAAGEWLRRALAEKPLDPPSRKELVHDRTTREALKFLVDTGEAVEVGPELVLAASAYAEAVAKVKDLLRRRGPATVSDLRQALGCTRRIMVPLCEKLDREGITRREGDFRRLGRAQDA